MNRKIDNVGRIVLPKEMRDKLRLNNGDEVNMTIKGKKIIVTNPKEDDPFETWLEDYLNKNLSPMLNDFDMGYMQGLNDILEKYKELR